MAKAKTVYTCQNCGAQSPKWMGKCPDCNQWNSYVEESYQPSAISRQQITENKPQLLHEIDSLKALHIPTKIAEFDRVLGGGFVPGSAILIGGDPGIGKSTLLLHALSKIARGDPSTSSGRAVLYVSGEESAAQIKTRADRLGVAEKTLWVVTENNLENLLALIKKENPDIVAIDSVQTIYSQNLSSAPGTVSQVRESCGQLIQLAKTTGITLFLVGHVTKEGAIAGPKVLEHMVDCVLYFESDAGHAFRIIRSVKNRFGAANEIGVFEMTGAGLREVANPSHLFLSERNQNAIGSVVAASLEGTRPLLLEIQALVTPSPLGTPRRTAVGVDANRIALLVAVLEKIIGITLFDQDIFVNIAGGIRVTEPALDLGLSLALYSSFRNLAIDPKTIFIGEVGLTGEVRAVSLIEPRLKEAAKLGFTKAIIPQGNAKSKFSIEGMGILPVKDLAQCLQLCF